MATRRDGRVPTAGEDPRSAEAVRRQIHEAAVYYGYSSRDGEAEHAAAQRRAHAAQVQREDEGALAHALDASARAAPPSDDDGGRDGRPRGSDSDEDGRHAADADGRRASSDGERDAAAPAGQLAPAPARVPDLPDDVKAAMKQADDKGKDAFHAAYGRVLRKEGNTKRALQFATDAGDAARSKAYKAHMDAFYAEHSDDAADERAAAGATSVDTGGVKDMETSGMAQRDEGRAVQPPGEVLRREPKRKHREARDASVSSGGADRNRRGHDGGRRAEAVAHSRQSLPRPQRSSPSRRRRSQSRQRPVSRRERSPSPSSSSSLTDSRSASYDSTSSGATSHGRHRHERGGRKRRRSRERETSADALKAALAIARKPTPFQGPSPGDKAKFLHAFKRVAGSSATHLMLMATNEMANGTLARDDLGDLCAFLGRSADVVAAAEPSRGGSRRNRRRRDSSSDEEPQRDGRGRDDGRDAKRPAPDASGGRNRGRGNSVKPGGRGGGGGGGRGRSRSQSRAPHARGEPKERKKFYIPPPWFQERRAAHHCTHCNAPPKEGQRRPPHAPDECPDLLADKEPHDYAEMQKWMKKRKSGQ